MRKQKNITNIILLSSLILGLAVLWFDILSDNQLEKTIYEVDSYFAKIMLNENVFDFNMDADFPIYHKDRSAGNIKNIVWNFDDPSWKDELIGDWSDIYQVIQSEYDENKYTIITNDSVCRCDRTHKVWCECSLDCKK